MAKQTIGIGSAANDGTGDPLRTAMSKVNDNFNEVYSSYQMTGKLSIGNSTVNSSVSNTGGLVTANVTATVTVNTGVIQISNSAGTSNLTATALKVGANVVANTSSLLVGNSTVNTLVTSTFVRVSNSTSTANLNPTSLTIGNSVANTTAVAVGANVVVNTSAISIGNSSTNVVINQNGITGTLSLTNVLITGNLVVNGTVTTVNTATLDVADLNITIAKNAANGALANGAGLTINGAAATISYISDSNTFNLSHFVIIGNTSANSTINATNFTGTSNNALYLGGVAAADYQTEAGLAANVATLAANSATYVLANSGIVSNSSGVFVNGNTGLVVNSTGVHVNAGYVQNTDSRTLSGNLYFTGANNVFAANTVGLGSSTIAANGYTYLPNGLKMNWGVVSANSSDGNVTFTSAFSTALYTITVTGTNTEITTLPVAIGANTTAALVRTSNATSVNVYFTAIGS
jgi:hypothetical protein